MALLHSPRCDRYKVSEMVSHVIEALAVLGFRHLGHHFLKNFQQQGTAFLPK